MILIDKYGFLHANDSNTNERYTIENKEVLSFLRNCISGIHNNFNVRDFIKLFERYDSLLAIVPEFEEVITCSKKYDDYFDIDIDSICMQIGGNIVAKESQESASMYFNLLGITKLQDNITVNIPAETLSLKNIINSKILILSDMDISFEISDDNLFKGHLPFDIHNFTLFDFIAIVASNLVKAAENDDAGDETFVELKQRIFKIKDTMKRMGINIDQEEPIDENNVKDNADNILKQMSDILNPNKGDNKKQ